MAEIGDPIPGIDPKHLQVEFKQDSSSKLAAIVGRLTKYFLFAAEFEILRTFVNKLRDDIDSIVSPYKVYTVLLTQVGAAAPTVTVLQNNTGKTFSCMRSSDGVYFLIANTAFANVNKVTCFISSTNGAYHYSARLMNTTDILVSTLEPTSGGTDGCLTTTPLEIRVYN